MVRNSILAGKRQPDTPPNTSAAQYAFASAHVQVVPAEQPVRVADPSRCQTSPVIVSVTVRPSVLTTNSPAFVPSPVGSLVPSQVWSAPLQHLAAEGQSAVVEQAPPK